ncbi:MAG: hypothetical protein EOM68_25130 [Spirochaetia bacterium]|nr:hypothetical protein [Spirochaetia bacterium]
MHYPDIADGVFLDEFINGWGEHEQRLEWYTELVSKIRARFGKHFLIVGNPGYNISPSVLALPVDVFMTFESTASAYLEEAPASPLHPAHMAMEPGTRFWHVIHDVTAENYREVFDKADKLGIGHLYVTDGRLVMGEGGQWQPEVNPYAVAPTSGIADLLSSWLKGVLDLRESVEAVRSNVLGDTGWVDITSSAPEPFDSSDENAGGIQVGQILVRRVGMTVFLRIIGVTQVNADDGGGIEFGILPRSFRPDYNYAPFVPMFPASPGGFSTLRVEGERLKMTGSKSGETYSAYTSFPVDLGPLNEEWDSGEWDSDAIEV